MGGAANRAALALWSTAVKAASGAKMGYRPQGRPTDCTPEKVAQICEFLRQGVSQECAATSAGLCERTFYVWLEKGREGVEPYVQFLQQVNAAENDAERMLVDTIRTQAAEDWKAGAWLLERRHPRRWGRLDRSEVTGANGAAIQVQAQVVEIPAPIADVAQWAASAKSKGDDE
jgi:hypothetical protein